MAGDWIKWEKGLINKPEVAQIARALSVSKYDAAARLMCIWEFADGATCDGNVLGMTADDIDEISGIVGMAHSMSKTRPAPWLLVDATGITFPNYERHNGKNAKRRAMEKNRQDLHRAKTGKESGYRPWHR